MSLHVRPLEPRDAPACDAIMATLPDFFGHQGGLDAAADAVRTQAGQVAEDGRRIVAFATWEPRNRYTAEITWMAVTRERRHGGIGTTLVEVVCKELRKRGFRLALAMTSAAPKMIGGDDTYGPTRQFWLARGFLPLAELDIWDTDLALLQVRSLELP